MLEEFEIDINELLDWIIDMEEVKKAQLKNIMQEHNYSKINHLLV